MSLNQASGCSKICTFQNKIKTSPRDHRLFIAEISVYLGEYAIESFGGADDIRVRLQPSPRRGNASAFRSLKEPHEDVFRDAVLIELV